VAVLGKGGTLDYLANNAGLAAHEKEIVRIQRGESLAIEGRVSI
jgi:hypothetical protein